MPNTHVPAAGEAMPATEVMPTIGRFSRRAILGALAIGSTTAAVLVVAPHADAAGDVDAELFRIEAEVNAAYAIYEDAADKVGEIEERVNRVKQPRPPKLPGTDEIKAAFWDMARGVDPDKIDDSWLAHPAAVAWRENDRQLTERFKAWQAECDEITRKSGLREAEDERDRTMNALNDIAEPLLDMRAQTLAGMLVKLRVHERWTFDEFEILESLTADIKAMADARS